MLSRKRSKDVRHRSLAQFPGALTSLYLILIFVGLLSAAYLSLPPFWSRQSTKSDEGHQLSSQGPNRSKLRSRSIYLDWRGESSEWFKRSPQGRFVFVFYDGVPLPTQPYATQQDAIKTTLAELASRSSTKYPFAYSSITMRHHIDTFSNILSDDFQEKEFPAALILDVTDGYKKYLVSFAGRFNMSNVVNLDSGALQTFFEEELLIPYQEKRMKPYLRSEKLEFDETSSVIHSINSTFFHTQLMELRAESEFFVTFYAPWCGHCRRFHELFQPLARLVRMKTPSIGFYKLDATKNDIDHDDITLARVPHVRFFSKYRNMKKPTIFDHRAKEVTEENLRTFLLTNSYIGKTLMRSWRLGEVNLDEL